MPRLIFSETLLFISNARSNCASIFLFLSCKFLTARSSTTSNADSVNHRLVVNQDGVRLRLVTIFIASIAHCNAALSFESDAIFNSPVAIEHLKIFL